MAESAPDTPQDVPGDPSEGESATAGAPRRFLFLRRRTPTGAPATEEAVSAEAGGAAPGEPPQAADDTAPAAEKAIRPGVLRRRRRELMGAYEQGIFDLGGLAMELHRRGMLAEHVMRRKAAELSDLRGQIDDVGQRLEAMRAERQERRQAGRGSTVACAQCGFRSRSTANFCASCGAPLDGAAAGAIEHAPDAATDVAPDQPTTVIVEEQVTTIIEAPPDDPQHTQVIPPRDGDEA